MDFGQSTHRVTFLEGSLYFCWSSVIGYNNVVLYGQRMSSHFIINSNFSYILIKKIRKIWNYNPTIHLFVVNNFNFGIFFNRLFFSLIEYGDSKLRVKVELL